jgi:hypothetical protein
MRKTLVAGFVLVGLGTVANRDRFINIFRSTICGR